MMVRIGISLIAGLLFLSPSVAEAFCGFYVGGADSQLYNNATQVVLMREGKRTVLSMRNNYQGPPKGFAMVVPVPVVLQEENVKTLPDEVFARVDKLSAPRLVEYWEQDPCFVPQPYDYAVQESGVMPTADEGGGPPRGLGVTIEAKFDVGEYNIVILSAKDSTGLETWLKQEKYEIPKGAAPYLRPYVEGGSKFFVAKVDPKKVKFKDGQTMLSPLRFHYDSEDFNLPVRLGLMNSSGTQDLLVHILAQGQRYEVANYPNVTIPTNINVKDSVRNSFGEFYAALFDSTLEKNPKAVVTEYSWDASTCDPCPEPALDGNELATLGYDVLPSAKGGGPRGFVLTRLHARYSTASLGEDLVFKAAPPIAGGREHLVEGNKLEEGSRPAGQNNFQGRYAMRHEWTGPIECENPQRGRWGGPPSGTQHSGTQAATDLAFAPRGKTVLANVVAQDVPEIGLVAGKAAPAKVEPADAVTKGEAKSSSKGKGCSTSGSSTGTGALLALAGLLLFTRKRKGL
jgi:MYXO-CTERM domain-containing protein